MVAKKVEIIEAVKKIAECYCQKEEISIIPFYSLNGSIEKLKDAEIKARWENLLKSIGEFK